MCIFLRLPVCPGVQTSDINDPPMLQYHDWAAILDLYRHASVSLNSRLHSGVLGLAAPSPSLYLANNVKYLDLMSSISLADLLFDPAR